MAKRTRNDISNPPFPDLNTSKFRRVAPKQEESGGMMQDSMNAMQIQENFPRTGYTNEPNFTLGNFQSLAPNTSFSHPQNRENVNTFQPAPAQPQQQVKFETALEFLDQVKLQFSGTPSVYKQFLKIMKDFKLHEIDTPGVIQRVSELFHGHDHLILGFNRFLPEGYKITLNDINAFRKNMPNISRNPPAQSENQTFPNILHPLPPTTQVNQAPVPPRKVENSPSQLVTNPETLSDSPMNSNGSQPELDHARNYVKKIKMRFEDQPEIYKSFLRILHTFHEEHHTIGDVYDKVASLFSSHSDLLAEFKQFLPEKPAVETPTRGSKRLKTTRRKTTESVISTPNANDYDFFESAKTQLRHETSLFTDFLKVLHLHNKEILSRSDLLVLVRDLFSEYPELFHEFQQFCNFNIDELPDSREKTPEPTKVIDSRCEIDFSTCKRYGLSYRQVPKEYVQPKCTGRTELCHEVLNDFWVSVPTGSEEFKASIKNEFEENLFACEDERHKLDMVIALNASTIHVLISIAKQIAEASDEELAHFKIQEGLDILHLRAIEQIYGTAKGKFIIQGLSENPVVAIPTVLRRLQQKDKEWQAARCNWNRVWQEVHEKNYIPSLDHRSAFFKQKDRRLLNPRELLAEVKNGGFTEIPPRDIDSTLATKLSFEMKEREIFNDIEKLIQFQAERLFSSQAEPEKLQTFLQIFIPQFFIRTLSENPHTLSGLFFGNNSFYVFFRFYQLLYSRLLETKKMSSDSFSDQTLTDTPMKLMMHRQLSLNTKRKFSSPDEKYSFFVKNLLPSYIDGNVDSVKYENQCREVFGVSSYILFTMDRLLQVLVKQILSIFLEDTSSKLFNLHSFETAKNVQTFSQDTYYTNALAITQEERCFKFLYTPSNGSFTIELLAPIKQSSFPSKSQPQINPPIQPKQLSSPFPSQTKFTPTPKSLPQVQQKIQESPDVYCPPEKVQREKPKSKRHDTNKKSLIPVEEMDTIDIRKHNVFLLRNKTAEKPANQHVIVSHGLECKVCTTTYRLFFVEQTEDFFYRPGQLTKAKNYRMSKQIQRLHKWVDSQLPKS